MESNNELSPLLTAFQSQKQPVLLLHRGLKSSYLKHIACWIYRFDYGVRAQTHWLPLLWRGPLASTLSVEPTAAYMESELGHIGRRSYSIHLLQAHCMVDIPLRICSPCSDVAAAALVPKQSYCHWATRPPDGRVGSDVYRGEKASPTEKYVPA